MREFFLKIFYDQDIVDLDVNSKELSRLHLAIMKKKKLLRSAYETFYKQMSLSCDEFFKIEGLEIELGSGVGFFKDLRNGIITSDIREGIDYDMSIDATNMNIKDNSIKCLFLINVFHHLSYPTKFFDELKRVLKKGGGCILIEPHDGLLSRLIHKNIHKDEYFDTNEIQWDKDEKSGVMSNANQALSHNVFERDKILFESKYGKDLKIIRKTYIINGLRYILSGGLNFKQLFPSFLISILFVLEFFFTPLAKYWTPFKMIVIKKIT